MKIMTSKFLMMVWVCVLAGGMAHARPIANLELFRDASEIAGELLPLPGVTSWKTEGFGSKDQDPEMLIGLQTTGMKRGDLGDVWLKVGDDGREFKEDKGGEWWANIERMSPPIEGSIMMQRIGGGLGVKVLCPPKESYIPTRPSLEGCFGSLKAAVAVKEELRLPGNVFLAPEVALGPQSAIFRMVLPHSEQRKGFISLFVSPNQQAGTDFSSWASVHFRMATEDCVVAPAKVIDLGKSLTKDGLKVSCSIRGEHLIIRLSSRFFPTGQMPQDLLGQFIAHDGLLAKDSELYDAVGPFRVQGP